MQAPAAQVLAHDTAFNGARRSVQRAATSYRDSTRGGVVHSAVELSEILQRRLRYLALWYVACDVVFTALVAGFFWRLIVARPLAVFTEPPLLGWLAIVALIALFVAHETRPDKTPALVTLRRLEVALFFPVLIVFPAMQSIILSQSLERFASNADWFATGSSAFWIVAMFAYAVQIPNTWQRCAMVMAAMSVCALVPDIGVLAFHSVPVASLVFYAALKGIWLVGSAVLATYSAHRIDTLTLDADDARTLGQYVLGDRIGGGGMGEVYRAEHQFLRRPCVVKLIRPGMEGDTDMLARFEREVQATAALTHPNTVQVFDYGRASDGTFFYVMEFLPGESIEAIVERDGPMAPRQVTHLLTQVCGALHEAHVAGMLHRDIKPANVLVCERGGISDFAKVLDFGLAGPIKRGGSDPRVTQAGMLLGTPDFMSPEQIGGEELSVASDIYAIGALAYYMLAGKVVFPRRTAMQALAAHVYETPAPLGLADSGALETIVLRCLAKTARERYADARELAAALAEAI